ncbi:uncharacterized protein LOC131736919 [Acipenser ruthenus]|uniref:uncharacterized protein LOC131736919 n=1 Tax=Acipenser ruthenus TaxID=7906 RepID=UPI0027408F25|nr:uncharacterized protein LOC131736919 [Acipenser ruthenus]
MNKATIPVLLRTLQHLSPSQRRSRSTGLQPRSQFQTTEHYLPFTNISTPHVDYRALSCTGHSGFHCGHFLFVFVFLFVSQLFPPIPSQVKGRFILINTVVFVGEILFQDCYLFTHHSHPSQLESEEGFIMDAAALGAILEAQEQRYQEGMAAMKERMHAMFLEANRGRELTAEPTVPLPRIKVVKMSLEDDPEAYLVAFESQAMAAQWPRD